MDLLQKYLLDPPKTVGPDYNILKYTDQIYKVVHFKQPRNLVPGPKRIKPRVSDDLSKPDSSVSRAKRVILELALCNDWKFFCTFTLDKMKYDRHNLDAWHKDFMQWVRDQRKKYKKLGYELDFKFLFVPELHADGAWHMHAFFGDITPLLIPFYCERQQGLKVPDKLVNGGYFDWPSYRDKFGFCSFGIIQNKVAAGFYVTKYIIKDMSKDRADFGRHIYIPSRGLNRAVLHGSVYGGCSYLDGFLTNKYEFVETGMTHVSDGLDWHFAFEYLDDTICPLDAFGFDQISEPEQHYFESYFEAVQMAMEGF